MTSVFVGYPPWMAAILAMACVFVVAYLIAELVARLARNVGQRILGARGTGFQATSLMRPTRLLRFAVFLLLAAVLTFPALEIAGIQTFVGMHPHALAAWFFESGIRIGFIVLLGFSIVRVVALIVSRFEQELTSVGGADYLEHVKRVRTLGNLLRSTVMVVVVSMATLMILRELNLDVTPVLTGAGIVGVALGFGAQTLVKDFISGFFLILENQVRVGDVANINGTGGLVEAITLRTIVLRDSAGTVYIFPNGSINTLANLTKDFSYYVIDVQVDYSEDTDRVIAVLREIAADLQREAPYASSILEPLEVIGVDKFTENWVVIQVRIKTLPLKQWEVGRELRRRMLKRFRSEGIAFPKPRVTLAMDTAKQAAMLASPTAAPPPTESEQAAQAEEAAQAQQTAQAAQAQSVSAESGAPESGRPASGPAATSRPPKQTAD
jgi:small-conductance mechanosensitive channel